MARRWGAWTCAARSPSSSTATAGSTTPRPTCGSSRTRCCSRRARAPVGLRRAAPAASWADVRVRGELVAPTRLFATLYLRYVAEDADSWDETKEHQGPATRESELIRDTSSGAFCAICADRPGQRWTVLQTLVDADDAGRRLLARELTIEEKREFVDLRIEGWLRTLGDGLSRELRREWSGLRELGKDDLMLRAIEQLIELEKPRGGRGA